MKGADQAEGKKKHALNEKEAGERQLHYFAAEQFSPERLWDWLRVKMSLRSYLFPIPLIKELMLC